MYGASLSPKCQEQTDPGLGPQWGVIWGPVMGKVGSIFFHIFPTTASFCVHMHMILHMCI